MHDLRVKYVEALNLQQTRFTLRSLLKTTGSKFHIINNDIVVCGGLLCRGCGSGSALLRINNGSDALRLCKTYFNLLKLIQQVPDILDVSVPAHLNISFITELINDRLTPHIQTIISTVNAIRKITQMPPIDRIDLSQLTSIKELYKYEFNVLPKMPLQAIANIYREPEAFIVEKKAGKGPRFTIQVYDHTYKINRFIIDLFVSVDNPEQSEIPQLTTLDGIPTKVEGYGVLRFMARYNKQIARCSV